MAEHLVRLVPTKMIRFFRAEVIERWKLDPHQVSGLDGSRGQLVTLLQQHCHFSTRRAQTEVDDFLREFAERMQRATDPLPGLPTA